MLHTILLNTRYEYAPFVHIFLQELLLCIEIIDLLASMASIKLQYPPYYALIEVNKFIFPHMNYVHNRISSLYSKLEGKWTTIMSNV